jgi:hypothetical protein
MCGACASNLNPHPPTKKEKNLRNLKSSPASYCKRTYNQNLKYAQIAAMYNTQGTGMYSVS